LKLVYVAGKYRGKTINETYENVALVREHSVKLWKLGYAVLCPHTNTSFMDGVMPDQAFLDGTMEMLKRCDLIYMIPNWKQSSGAILEREYAQKNGIPELKI